MHCAFIPLHHCSRYLRLIDSLHHGVRNALQGRGEGAVTGAPEQETQLCCEILRVAKILRCFVGILLRRKWDILLHVGQLGERESGTVESATLDPTH